MYDADDAASYVQQITGEDVNIIFGAMYDDTQADTCRVTVIATGLDSPQVGRNEGFSFGTRPNIAQVRQNIQAANAMKNPGQPVPAVPKPIFNSIQKPADIKSKVEENTLKIPEFLQKK